MGQISTKLAARLKKSRKLTDELRREAKSIQASLNALQNGGPPWPPDDDLHPPHAVYIAVRNVSSFFAERVSVFPEFVNYYDRVAKAEDEFLPSCPPMSPLTRSYFTAWAFYDVR